MVLSDEMGFENGEHPDHGEVELIVGVPVARRDEEPTRDGEEGGACLPLLRVQRPRQGSPDHVWA